jgi:tetratricopeptide (TPR) repeat protein
MDGDSSSRRSGAASVESDARAASNSEARQARRQGGGTLRQKPPPQKTSLATLVHEQRALTKAVAAISARLDAMGAPAAPAEPDPVADLVRAVAEAPDDPKPRMTLGKQLFALHRIEEAEALFRQTLAINARLAQAHHYLGLTLQKQGKNQEAIASFRAALDLDGNMRISRRSLSAILTAENRVDEALAVWEAEFTAQPHDSSPLHRCVRIALDAHRLEAAGEYARRQAAHRWGTRFWPERRGEDPPFARVASEVLKAPKLRHDIDQLGYLQERGVFGSEITPVIQGLQRALDRVAPAGDVARLPLNEEERLTIGPLYSRILHVGDAPRVPKALSYDWDMKAIEDRYIENPPGILCIDDLLSREALESLYRFCLESTFWSLAQYSNGYLGAVFKDGFNAPLLLQIVEELRAAMPRIIGSRPLQNMWAYKYDQQMGGIKTHADPAAVNVNFWITPDEANLDPASGGLVVYDAEAPQDWDFDEFNKMPQKIHAFLDAAKARPVTFPYKRNRAVIFNSDLFHRTAPYRFKPGYTHRRINVTMLFGTRNDQRLDAG